MVEVERLAKALAPLDLKEGGRNEVALHSHQGYGRPDPGLRAAAHSGQRLPRYWAGGLGGPRRGRYRPGDRRQHPALGGCGRTPRPRTARQAQRARGTRLRLKGVRGSPWGCRGGGELGSAQRQVGCAHGRGAARCGSRQGAYLLVPEPMAKFGERLYHANTQPSRQAQGRSRQAYPQQRGARKTHDGGASGLPTSLLCETHSSGATRRERSLFTAPLRIAVVISVVGDLLPTTPVGLDRPDLTVASGVVDIGYPLT